MRIKSENEEQPLVVIEFINLLKKNKMKLRIVKKTNVDGVVSYTIQQRHFLFRWWWVDAWVNNDASTVDTFSTLEEAKKNLCYFDNSKVKHEIINL